MDALTGRKEHTMSRILYCEMRTDQEYNRWVRVEVRSWVEDDMCPDVVIHTHVSIDHELVIDAREVFSHAAADAEFIRMGIERFDAMVAQHLPSA